MGRRWWSEFGPRSLAGKLRSEPAGAARGGFTLVELLAVIVIIGILVGLITAGLVIARRNMKIAKISMELKNIDQALRNYQEKYGELPPDCSNIAGTVVTVSNTTLRTKARGEFIRHLLRVYPRLDQATVFNNAASIDSQWDNLASYILNSRGSTSTSFRGYSLSINHLCPASALPFWLGGPWQLQFNGTYYVPQVGKLGGFSANPANPFDGSPTRLPQLFEFEETRLFQPTYNGGNQFPYYGPDTGTGKITPYVYFKARSYGVQAPGNTTSTPGYDPAGALGSAQVCYYRNLILNTNETVYPWYHVSINPVTGAAVAASSSWYEAKRFQILCAGLDGIYGQACSAPLGFNVTGAIIGYNGVVSPPQYEVDNQSNFMNGVFEDEK